MRDNEYSRTKWMITDPQAIVATYCPIGIFHLQFGAVSVSVSKETLIAMLKAMAKTLSEFERQEAVPAVTRVTKWPRSPIGEVVQFPIKT